MKVVDLFRLKPLSIIAVLCGITSAQASAVAPNIVYHPVHYKPNTNFLIPSGLTPAQISTAYGFNRVAAQGAGQVIAIVEAFNHPNIEADLEVFNNQFGLPACTVENGCFQKIMVNEYTPTANSSWSGGIALDVEWAHAMAPAAKIILVEAASDSSQDLFDAVQVAINTNPTIVSMSWGEPEYYEETQLDYLFNIPNITFTAASGDTGTGMIYPAASPYVLAVGGTTLVTDASGNYQSEKAWSGSGGGLSSVEICPSYQINLPIPQSEGRRGVPDVSYNADPDTGFSVYNSVAGEEGSGWQVIGGTSAGAAQWAALIAVVNSSKGSNIGNNLNALLYNPAQVPSYFNDIVTGSNGDCGFLCTAVAGYDYVTGLGSPKVANLVAAF